MIYVLSHDQQFSNELVRSLGDSSVEKFSDEARLAAALAADSPETVIFDIRYDGTPSILMERIYYEHPSISLIVVASPPGRVDETMADMTLFWPVPMEEIAQAVQAVKNDRNMISSCGLIGRSPELAAAARIVLQVAPTDINVLITGPSGSGKEMIARALHANSSIPNSPFVAVNVAALAPGIIESELFGHEKGSFTGAASRRIGHFEQASGGAIFLDEIGEIPLEIQAKLLRVLEQRTFSRVGGNATIRADFRLIAATNKGLAEEVERGRFREDLYYRLRVVSIDLPPLVRRKADIAPLALQFLQRRSRELSAANLHIEPGAMRLFHKYDWPGNVRELKNVIDSFAVTSQSGRIRAADFEKYMLENSSRSSLLPVVTHRTPGEAEHQLILQALMTLSNEIASLRRLIERELEVIHSAEPVAEADKAGNGSVNVEVAERNLIERALSQAQGNRKRAARMLGIGERTLYRKLEKYGLK